MLKGFKEDKKHVLSPVLITVGILISWVAGLLIGVGINNVITRYISYDTEIQYGLLIMAFVLGSAMLGVPIAFWGTRAISNVILNINDTISRVADGDFSARLNPITNNPEINSTVRAFNDMVSQLGAVVVLKNDFIAGFSHEFKTPIVSVKGYAELLEESPNLNAEQREYLRIIKEEAHRLSTLSENVLKLAKLESQSEVENTVFNLSGQLEDCILILDSECKKKNIEIESDFDEVILENDHDLLKEVWINLLNNAVKFTGEGGKIFISVKEVGANAVVTIKDDGVGMSDDVKGKIFEKFYQVDNTHSRQGIGLGLTIVKSILKLTNGNIICNSEPNKGTEMIVSFKKYSEN